MRKKHWSVCLYVRLSVCLSVCLFVCLFGLFVCASVLCLFQYGCLSDGKQIVWKCHFYNYHLSGPVVERIALEKLQYAITRPLESKTSYKQGQCNLCQTLDILKGHLWTTFLDNNFGEQNLDNISKQKSFNTFFKDVF